MALTALDEAQRGRLLALAWIDSQFKVDFEKDPAAALRSLKLSVNTPGKPDKATLMDIGLDPDSNVKDRLVDLLTVKYPADFRGMPCAQLDDVIQKGKPEMAEDDWSWDGIVEATATNAGTALALSHWGRIYARIWMDDRIDTLPNACKEKYGPQQKYREAFETDPAAVVEAITQELKSKGIVTIPYTRGVDRLFVLLPRPDAWTDPQVATCVKTGKLEGKTNTYPLQWICKKCC